MSIRGLATVLLACLSLPAQHTFGATVVEFVRLGGRVYLLEPKTRKLPGLSRMQPIGNIHGSLPTVWPQSVDEGFPGLTGRVEWFAIDYTGRFWIEEPGEYRFSLLSDDGAKLRIGGKEVIDANGIRSPVAFSGSAKLSRRVHTIRVTYFQGPRSTVALVLAIGRLALPLADFSRHPRIRPSGSRERSARCAGTRLAGSEMPCYSGSGLPLVSGANGSAARPTRNTAHIVTPA